MQCTEAQKADKEITVWRGQIKAARLLTRLQQSLTNEISDGGQTVTQRYITDFIRRGYFLKKGCGVWTAKRWSETHTAFPGRNVWLSNVLSVVIIVQSSDVWSETLLFFRQASCSEFQAVSSRAVKIAEKLNLNFVLKYYQYPNYIKI